MKGRQALGEDKQTQGSRSAIGTLGKPNSPGKATAQRITKPARRAPLAALAALIVTLDPPSRALTLPMKLSNKPLGKDVDKSSIKAKTPCFQGVRARLLIN